METQRVGVFIGDAQGALSKELSLSDLFDRVKNTEDLYVAKIEKSLDNGGRAEISALCDKESLSAAVICGLTDQDFVERPLSTDGDASVTIPIIRANLLERGAWISSNAEEAMDRAERIIRVAVARARRARPIALSNRLVNRKVVVLGGNHGAFQTALSLAAADLKVTLLQTPSPSGCFFPLTDELAKSVADNPSIEAVGVGTLSRIDGQVGDFHLVAEIDGKRRVFDAGAVVVAVDAHINVDPDHGLPLRGSLRGFMEEVNGADAKTDTVAILLDRNGPERRCAAEAAVASARKHVDNGGKCSILLRNMPVYGKNGQKFYDDARAAGVQFLRYDEVIPSFEEKDGKLDVSMVDSIIPDRGLAFTIDRLIQPATVKPNLDNPALTGLLRQPLDAEGFLQPGNIRHMPVASARRGILFAGGCHNDCDPFEARYESDAVAATVLRELPDKAIPAPVEITKVDVGKCVSCLTCLRLCPHGAIETYLNKESVTILSSACWECGICAAVCPGQAITHGSLSTEQIEDVLVEATAEIHEHKPTVVFACQQSAVPSLNMAGKKGLTVPIEATFIEVPCAGRVDETVMMKALEQGAERVLVMGCHPEVCRSLHGNLLAEKRVKRIRGLLEATGVNPEIIQYHPIANNEPYRLVHILDRVIHPENEEPTQPSDQA